MMPQSLDIIPHLLLDICQDLVGAGVHGARKHEVVPDKNTSLIHHAVKLVLFELTSSPQPDHIESAKLGVLPDVFVGLMGGTG